MSAMIGFAQQPDTIFLKSRNAVGHTIFVDPNPNSVYYQKIADTSYKEHGLEYKESIAPGNMFSLQDQYRN